MSTNNTAKLVLVSLVAIFLLATPITAALADDTSPLNTLPETVISATALPTPSEEIGSSVTVITQDQIERDQRRTIPDLLQTVPGLNVVQTGGAGGQTSVFIRGTNSNHVKVLIDGIEVSDPTQPARAFDFGNLTTADIDRIEILRGPQSGLYGADAIGGVISITTKQGSGPPQWKAMVEGGSFGTFNQSIGVSGGTQSVNYAFTAAHVLSTSTPVTPLNLLPPGEVRHNDFYDNWTYSGKVGVNLSEVFALNFVGRYTDAALHFTQDDSFPSFPNPDQSSSRNHEFYGLTDAVWKLLDGKFNNHVGIAYTDVTRRAFDPDSFLAFSPPLNLFAGNRIKYYWKSDLALAPGQTLYMGVEEEQEKATFDEFGFFAKGSNQNLGSYAELHSAFADRLFLTSNIRFDQNENFGGHATWRLAPSYVIKETNTILKASYGTGFHAPALDQIFGPFGANPNLKPEESRGYDFGFEQGLLQKRVRFGVTYFNNSIKDLIVPDPITFINENVAAAKIHGIESFVSVAVTDRFQIRTDYTRTIAIDATTGLELIRRPENKTSVSAVWQPTDPWTLSATLLWVGHWMDVPRAGGVSIVAPGYNTVNLAANYKVSENLVVFGRVDNLFDKHYEDPFGFERPGLGVYGGIRVVR
ncbi:MAG TPA: TonB-dependent receptor [Xanthobacteraceae bacterium]|nr:TonB-dependent receptor [Xanthobacteraceae bacterium]